MSAPHKEVLDQGQCPLFRLPLEVRRIIWSNLLQPQYHLYDAPNDRQRLISRSQAQALGETLLHAEVPVRTAPTIHIRNLNPATYTRPPAPGPRHYLVRDFRGQASRTTSVLHPNPHLEPTILRTCRRLQVEASPTLYRENIFDFSLCTEAVASFLLALSPDTRRLIRTVRIVKRPPCYDREFDSAEWEKAMEALAGLRLENLVLVVQAGDLTEATWGALDTEKAERLRRGYEDGQWRGLLRLVDFAWIRELVKVVGLKEVVIEKTVEHCPPPVSVGLENWIRLSVCVDGSFTRLLRKKMVMVADSEAIEID